MDDLGAAPFQETSKWVTTMQPVQSPCPRSQTSSSSSSVALVHLSIPAFSKLRWLMMFMFAQCYQCPCRPLPFVALNLWWRSSYFTSTQPVPVCPQTMPEKSKFAKSLQWTWCSPKFQVDSWRITKYCREYRLIYCISTIYPLYIYNIYNVRRRLMSWYPIVRFFPKIIW